ncbi:DUF2141 domain-containing protein [Nonlabens xiamenensis]|uniref:DUF2141 domain-containing protein n=1 Tax=Nonlabens xiamenensis TaxID=2341043 RepID=UPI000F60A5D7|nr:DUF2141 domain-containing protein [Nonlabens xiamenensis]
MKFLFTSIILLIASFAMAQDTHQLTVKINNAKTDDGHIVISLSTQDQFLKAAAFKTAKVEIKEGQATAVFEDVPVGTYAVLVLHDMNGNGRMDYSNAGMPEEDYGMSNNPMSYGPPTWGDAKFDFEKDTEMIIRL